MKFIDYLGDWKAAPLSEKGPLLRHIATRYPHKTSDFILNVLQRGTPSQQEAVLPHLDILESSQEAIEALLDIYLNTTNHEPQLLMALKKTYHPRYLNTYLQALDSGEKPRQMSLLQLLTETTHIELLPYLINRLDSPILEIQNHIWDTLDQWADLPEVAEYLKDWMLTQDHVSLHTHEILLENKHAPGLLFVFEALAEEIESLRPYLQGLALRIEHQLMQILFRPHHTFLEIKTLIDWLFYFPELDPKDQGLRYSAIQQGLKHLDKADLKDQAAILGTLLQLPKSEMPLQTPILEQLFTPLTGPVIYPTAPHIHAQIPGYLTQWLESVQDPQEIVAHLDWLTSYFSPGFIQPLTEHVVRRPELIPDIQSLFLKHQDLILQNMVQRSQVSWPLLRLLSPVKSFPMSCQLLDLLLQDISLTTLVEHYAPYAPRLAERILKRLQSQPKPLEMPLLLGVLSHLNTGHEPFEVFYYQALHSQDSQCVQMASNCLMQTQGMTLEIIDWGIEANQESVVRDIIQARGLPALSVVFSSLAHYQHNFHALQLLKPLLLEHKQDYGEFGESLFQYLDHQEPDFRAFILMLLLSNPPASHILQLVALLETIPDREAELIIQGLSPHLTEDLYAPILARILGFHPETHTKVKSLLAQIPAAYFGPFLSHQDTPQKTRHILRICGEMGYQLEEAKPLLGHPELTLDILRFIGQVKAPWEKAVLPYLDHPDHMLMAQAIECLSQLQSPTLTSYIPTFLSHPEPVVRHATLRAIGYLKLSDYHSDLIYHLEQATFQQNLPLLDAVLDALNMTAPTGAKTQLLSLRNTAPNVPLRQKTYQVLSQYGGSFFSRLITEDFENSESQTQVEVLLPFMVNTPQTTDFRSNHFLEWPLSLQRKALSYWHPQNTDADLFFMKQLLFQGPWEIQYEVLMILRQFRADPVPQWFEDFEDGVKADQRLQAWVLLQVLQITKSIYFALDFTP